MSHAAHLDDTPDISWISGMLTSTQLNLLFPSSNPKPLPFVLVEYPPLNEVTGVLLTRKPYTALYASVVGNAATLMQGVSSDEDMFKKMRSGEGLFFQVWEGPYLHMPLLVAPDVKDACVLSFLRTERALGGWLFIESFTIDSKACFRVWEVISRDESGKLLRPSVVTLMTDPKTAPDGVLDFFLPIVEPPK